MFNWLKNSISNTYTLLYRFFFKKNAKILILGLDNAGKTTLLGLLKSNSLSMHAPTTTPNYEEFTLFGTVIKAFDLGGHKSARVLWTEYLCNVDGVIFIMDAADRSRFFEAKEELTKLLYDDSLRGVPILIMGNKVDLPRATTQPELLNLLGMSNYTNPLHKVFMCSITKKYHHLDGIEWLTSNIK